MLPLIALAAYQVISGYQQAETIREQARLKKQIDDINADDAELDAYKAEQYGYTESARYQSVVDQTVAGQRAAYAANNVDVSYGTAAQKQNETRLTGYFNMLEMQRRGKERALGYKREARNIRLGSAFARQQGEIDAASARAHGISSGLSTGITGYSRGSYGLPKSTPSSSLASTDSGLDSGTASQQFRQGNLAYDTSRIA